MRRIRCYMRQRELCWYMMYMDEGVFIRMHWLLMMGRTCGRVRPRKRWDSLVTVDLGLMSFTVEVIEETSASLQNWDPGNKLSPLSNLSFLPTIASTVHHCILPLKLHESWTMHLFITFSTASCLSLSLELLPFDIHLSLLASPPPTHTDTIRIFYSLQVITSSHLNHFLLSTILHSPHCLLSAINHSQLYLQQPLSWSHSCNFYSLTAHHHLPVFHPSPLYWPILLHFTIYVLPVITSSPWTTSLDIFFLIMVLFIFIIESPLVHNSLIHFIPFPLYPWFSPSTLLQPLVTHFSWSSISFVPWKSLFPAPPHLFLPTFILCRVALHLLCSNKPVPVPFLIL